MMMIMMMRLIIDERDLKIHRYTIDGCFIDEHAADNHVPAPDSDLLNAASCASSERPVAARMDCNHAGAAPTNVLLAKPARVTGVAHGAIFAKHRHYARPDGFLLEHSLRVDEE